MKTKLRCIKVVNLFIIVSFIITPIYPVFADNSVVSSDEGVAVAGLGSEDKTNLDENSNQSETPKIDLNSENSPKKNVKTDSLPEDTLDKEKEPEEDLPLATTGSVAKIEKQKVTLGEVDERSGAYSYSYSFALPPFRGMNPELSLNYNSQNESKNSITGYGWELSIPYIRSLNRTSTNNMYNNNSFYSSLSGELIKTQSADTYGSIKDNGTYLEYKKNNDNSWSMTTKDGTVYNFGTASNARQDNPSNASQVYTWYLSSIVDLNGNTILFTYNKDNNQIYPVSIDYGIFNVSLEYQDIPSENQISQYSSNFQIKTTKKLSSVKTYINNILNNTVNIIYSFPDPDFNRVYLIDKIIDNSISGNPKVTDFNYGTGDFNFTSDTSWNMPSNGSTGLLLNSNSAFIDINNDNLPDFVYTSTGTSTSNICNDSTNTVFINHGNDVGFVRDPNWIMPCNQSGGVYYKMSLSENKGTIVDIDRDGLPDIIFMPGGSYSSGSSAPYNDIYRTVFKNDGMGFNRDSSISLPCYKTTNSSIPCEINAGGGATAPTLNANSVFIDINNDGYLDLITTPSNNSSFLNNSPYSSYNDYLDTVYIYSPNKQIGSSYVKGFFRDPNWTMPFYNSGTTNYRLRLDTFSNFSDLNNDGLPDFFYTSSTTGFLPNNAPYNNSDDAVFINNGTGFVRDTEWNMPYYQNGTNNQALILNGTKSTFTDVNNDGLPDFFYSDAGVFSNNNHNDPTRTVFINNGHSFVRDTDFSMPYSDSSGLASGVLLGDYASFIDVNNDGLSDFIYDNYGPFSGGNNPPYNDSLRTVFVNTGSDFVRYSSWNMPYYLNGSTFTSLPINSSYGTFIDLNSDGLTDFVGTSLVGNSSTDTVFLNSGPKDVLLNSITTTSGGNVTVSYTKKEIENLFPGGNSLPANINVVDSITYDDLFTPQATTNYAYENGKYYYSADSCQDCLHYKKYAGFAMTAKTDPTGNVTKTYYHQGDGNNTTTGEYNDNEYKIGKTYRIEEYDNQNHLYRLTMNKWEDFAFANGYNFASLNKQTVMNYDSDDDHVDTSVEYSYDERGNIINKINYGTVTTNPDWSTIDIGTDKTTENITYAYKKNVGLGTCSSDESDNRSFLASDTIFDIYNNKIKESKIYYDGLELGCSNHGNPTKIEKWIRAGKLGNPDVYIATQSAYNVQGLPILTIDANNNTTFYTYDSYNLYPTSIKNPLNQFTYYTYDYSSGKVTQTTDENGLVYQTVYDALDRVIEEKSPSFTSPYTPVTKTTYTYTDTPGATSIKTTNYLDATNSVDTYQYLDGFGRLIQERSEAEGTNNYNVKDTVYNSRGLVEKQSLPYASTGYAKTPKTTNNYLYITNTYDPLGRIKTINDATGTTTYAYDDWVTTTTDKNGKVKKYYKDAYNNLIKVDEINGAQTYSTNYTWNLNGNLIKITDALGNIRNFTYDGLGRRLGAEDLHAPTDTTFGTWQYVYDNNNNLTKAVSPRSNVINYTYNAINQLISEDTPSTSGIDTAYTYGGCNLGINKICSVTTRQNVNTTYTYDSNGNIINEMKNVNGFPFTTSYSYDYLGNKTLITYPDGAEVKYTYNNAGLLDKIEEREGGGIFTNIISNYDYNPLNQVSTMTYGNGVITTNTYNSGALYRLTNRLTQNTSLLKLQDLNYIYDPAGNIARIIDASNTPTAKTLLFTYDDLYRLTGVTGSYNQSFSYNAIGNLISGPGGSYSYGGGAGNYYNPHAVTQINKTSQYYDNEGNLTSYSNITNTWNYKNQLEKNQKGTNYYSKVISNYLYDHSGERVYQNITSYYDGTRNTYYPNDYYNYYLDGVNDLATKETKQIYGNGELVATIETTLDIDENDDVITIYTTRFDHTDHLGSISKVSNADGSLAESLDYYPFGAPRISNGSYINQRQYIGEIYDSISELNYLNARYYDGRRGQFISQDPEFWNPEKYLMDPQSLNSYSYARNNPINLSDPSGLDWGDRFRGAAITAGEVVVTGVVIAAILATAEITIPATAILALSGVGVIGAGYGAYKNERAYSNGQITESQHDYNQGALFVGGTTSAVGVFGGVYSLSASSRAVGETASEISTLKWARLDTLSDHFTRHGGDFGAKNPNEYVKLSQDFFKNSNKNGYLTKIDNQGTTRIYDPKSNTFGSYDSLGQTKTFYKPDQAIHKYPSNMDYWNAQPGR